MMGVASNEFLLHKFINKYYKVLFNCLYRLKFAHTFIHDTFFIQPQHYFYTYRAVKLTFVSNKISLPEYFMVDKETWNII